LLRLRAIFIESASRTIQSMNLLPSWSKRFLHWEELKRVKLSWGGENRTDLIFTLRFPQRITIYLSIRFVNTEHLPSINPSIHGLCQKGFSVLSSGLKSNGNV